VHGRDGDGVRREREGGGVEADEAEREGGGGGQRVERHSVWQRRGREQHILGEEERQEMVLPLDDVVERAVAAPRHAGLKARHFFGRGMRRWWGRGGVGGGGGVGQGLRGEKGGLERWFGWARLCLAFRERVGTLTEGETEMGRPTSAEGHSLIFSFFLRFLFHFLLYFFLLIIL
jgi:hypothetical protein